VGGGSGRVRREELSILSKAAEPLVQEKRSALIDEYPRNRKAE
jgi:hypothetical protein